MNRTAMFGIAGTAAVCCVATIAICRNPASPSVAEGHAPFLSIPLPSSEGTVVSKHQRLRAQIVDLPNIVYVGEQRSFCVELSNPTDTRIDFEATCYVGEASKHHFHLSLLAHGTAVQTLPLCVMDSDSNQTVRLDLACGSDRLAGCQFVLRDTRADLSGIETDGLKFQTGKNVRVVLVHRHPDEATYRRFQILNEVTQWRERAGTNVVLSVPDFEGLDGSPATNLPAMIAELIAPRRIVRYDCTGNPFEAALHYAQRLPSKGPIVLCIGCGRDEAFQHLPPDDFERAIDVLLTRAELWNPSIHLLLVTPVPIAGEEKITETYAIAIRNAGRQHRAQIVDVHALTLKTPNWISWFAQGDGTEMLDLAPNAAGRRIIAAWIAEALK